MLVARAIPGSSRNQPPAAAAATALPADTSALGRLTRGSDTFGWLAGCVRTWWTGSRPAPTGSVRPTGCRTIVQGSRLRFSEPERRLHLVDARWQISVSALRPRSLVANEAPFAPCRPLARDDNDALGGVEMLLDRIPPIDSAADVRISPGGKPVRFEGLDERHHAPPMLRFV
jgi:hypothetical protein